MEPNSSLELNAKTARILTARELQILTQIAFGYSSKEIAKLLYLSTHTINNHRKKMLGRTKCGNIAELVRIAMTENLL